MIYCPNCGFEVDENARFCPNCGTMLMQEQEEIPAKRVEYLANQPIENFSQSQGMTQPYGIPLEIQKKDPIIALVISFFIPGMGQVYAGKPVRGVVILLLMVFFPLILVFPFIGLVTPGFMMHSETSITFLVVVFFIMFIIYMGFFFWNLYDAYRVAERYNQFLFTYGRPPSNFDKW